MLDAFSRKYINTLCMQKICRPTMLQLLHIYGMFSRFHSQYTRFGFSVCWRCGYVVAGTMHDRLNCVQHSVCVWCDWHNAETIKQMFIDEIVAQCLKKIHCIFFFFFFIFICFYQSKCIMDANWRSVLRTDVVFSLIDFCHAFCDYHVCRRSVCIILFNSDMSIKSRETLQLRFCALPQRCPPHLNSWTFYRWRLFVLSFSCICFSVWISE